MRLAGGRTVSRGRRIGCTGGALPYGADPCQTLPTLPRSDETESSDGPDEGPGAGVTGKQERFALSGRRRSPDDTATRRLAERSSSGHSGPRRIPLSEPGTLGSAPSLAEHGRRPVGPTGASPDFRQPRARCQR